MKALAVLAVSLMISSAHASYMRTTCSNSTGTVMWETGYESNKISLKYAQFVEGTLTLDIDQVDIEFPKEVLISEKTMSTCEYMSHSKVYAGKVRITPATNHPQVLRGNFPENMVETEVICSFQANNELPCPTR